MRFKRCMGIILLMVLMLTACSPDPRVAPFEAWIVGVDAPTVLYDEDYGTRILIMQKGEDADVEIIHNREPRHKVTISAPSSDEHYVATVSELDGMKFRIHAEDGGCAKVVVNVQGEKVRYLYGDNRAEAYVYVIVRDENSPNGLFVEVAHVDGLIESLDGYTLYATSVQDLSSKSLNLKFTTDSSIQIKKVEWYVNGHLESNDKDFCLSLDTFGVHTVNCIVYNEYNGGVLLPCGTSSVNITAKYI